jgi:hypothetical protein
MAKSTTCCYLQKKKSTSNIANPGAKLTRLYTVLHKVSRGAHYPDQWGFWEWLGQNTSVGVSPETFLLLLLHLLQAKSRGAGASRRGILAHNVSVSDC